MKAAILRLRSLIRDCDYENPVVFYIDKTGFFLRYRDEKIIGDFGKLDIRFGSEIFLGANEEQATNHIKNMRLKE